MTTLYNQVLTAPLDVVDTYKELMAVSVGQGSIYLKAKETIMQYVEDGNLSEREKADIVSKHITDMANSMTAQTLQVALAISKENRDAPYTLTKLREDTKLVSANVTRVEAEKLNVEESTKQITANINKIKAEELNIKENTELITAQTLKVGSDRLHVEATTTSIASDTKLKVMSGWKAQADLYWDYGVLAYNLTAAQDIVPESMYDKDFGIKRQTISKAQADVYTTLATNYRQNGQLDISSKGDVFPNNNLPVGLSIIQKAVGVTPTAAELGLTYEQTKVAERQVTGFDDNMRQHIVNSSASMISMLLATEEASLATTADTEILPLWMDAAQHLNGNSDYTPPAQ